MNLPRYRIAAGLGKAALKTHALQTLRDRRASPYRAKRLECVRFIGAFRPARDGQRFMAADSRTKLSALLRVRLHHSTCFAPLRLSGLMFLILVGSLAAGGRALAERYLSLVEVQKVCFPEADQFEAQTIRLTPEESKAIEQKSGAKVRDRESRLWLARKGTNVVGVLVLDHVLGKHEVIDYAVAVSAEGKVLQVEILEYREHYGGAIRQAQWREQFKGKTAGSKLKLNDDIYNISGATISCRNVTDGVRRVLATFELVVRPRLGPGGRLSDAPTTQP